MEKKNNENQVGKENKGTIGTTKSLLIGALLLGQLATGGLAYNQSKQLDENQSTIKQQELIINKQKDENEKSLFSSSSHEATLRHLLFEHGYSMDIEEVTLRETVDSIMRDMREDVKDRSSRFRDYTNKWIKELDEYVREYEIELKSGKKPREWYGKIETVKSELAELKARSTEDMIDQESRISGKVRYEEASKRLHIAKTFQDKRHEKTQE